MSNILDKYRKKPIKKKIIPFLSSIKEDKWILKEDIIGSIAHVIMLKETKILTEEEAKLILIELIDILQKVENQTLIVDESFEDIHPFIEKLVIDKSKIEIGGKIHTSRSRNDQVALDIRLKLRTEILEILDLLIELTKTCLNFAKKTINVPIPLYTHLQRAQIGTVSHTFSSYIAELLRNIERTLFLYKDINGNPLGSSAIGGSSFPINRELTTKLLGFNRIIINSLDAVGSRDHLILANMIFSLIGNSLSRICNDLIIWSSSEFNFIEVDDGYASVSSAMPQKKNPDTLEIMRGKIARVFSDLEQQLFLNRNIPSGYVRDYQECKKPLISSIEILKDSIQVLSEVIDTLKINETQLNFSCSDEKLIALDVAEFIVKNTSLSFREAHQCVGYLVKKYTNSNQKVIFTKNSIENAISELFKIETKLDAKKIDNFKNINFVLKERISLGSPNPKLQNDYLLNVEQEISKFKNDIRINKSNLENSLNLLLSKANEIIGKS